MTTLYVLTESGADHSCIIGIFDTREAAEAEKAWCEANDTEMHRRHARGYTEDMYGVYSIHKYLLNRSNAHIIFRFDDNGNCISRHFDKYSDSDRVLFYYDEPLEDGTCVIVNARTEDEAHNMIISESLSLSKEGLHDE